MLLQINGNDVDVIVNILGKYHPPTQFDPPEYPEVEIQTITVFGRKLLKGKPLRVNEEQYIKKYYDDILEKVL